MNSSKKITETFSEYANVIETALQDVLALQNDIPMYKHLGYFMGFYDESFKKVSCYGGKRFRSSLCLMLAHWYGEKEAGVAVATSIELFHNFSLIHDDIVDGDVTRRGRPTVWKLLGTDHAINSGDAQLILALQIISDSEVLSAMQKVSVQSFLITQYLSVIEGQYYDFELTNKALGSEFVHKDAYFTMIGKKTADLVAASTKSVGILVGKNEEECSALFEYGYNLGVAYQLCDDMVSIWGSEQQTGKSLYGDILKKKKTLPILYLYENGDTTVRNTLTDVYSVDREVTPQDAQEVVALLDMSGVYIYMNNEIKQRTDVAKEAIHILSLTEPKKEILKNIVDQLILNIKKI